jgi:nitrite reductase/ring-hydroxylating ferredoxin subunit
MNKAHLDMATDFAAGQRVLCRIDEIPDGKARGFPPRDKSYRSLFAIRRGQHAFVYINECPHAGAELEYAQDRFLSADGQRIICFAHNAQFVVESGACTGGPCTGQSLAAVPVNIENGMLMIPMDAGRVS